MISIEGLPLEVHHCTSHREGEWITWRCPHCEDYERRYNWQTGEMHVKKGNSTAQHVGSNDGGTNMSGLTKIQKEQWI